MANIEIVYRKGSCEFNFSKYKPYCHSEYACEAPPDCSYFSDGTDIRAGVIGYGNCVHAKYQYCYKGMSTNNYEVEEDDNEPIMLVKIGKKEYECVKVKLNGKCIFNEFDDEEEK